MVNLCSVVIDKKSYRSLSEVEIADAWFERDNRKISRFTAPFALCGRRHSGGRFNAITDHYGLAHLFGWQGKGVCAISSSALVIGRVFQLEADREAIGEYGLLGHYLGSATAVQGVRKSKPGTMLELGSGQLTCSRILAPEETDPLSPAECLDHGMSALRESVSTHIEAFPECDIELSGGIDSRLLLAAIPKARRHRHTAVTLGSADSKDCIVANQLTQLNGMRHKVIDIERASELERNELLDLLRAASLRHDHAGNPIDKLALEIARPQLGTSPRLSGQNGEMARGFYYTCQPLYGSFEQNRHDRLVNWRLTGNDTVRLSILNDGFSDNARTALVRNTRNVMRAHDSWSAALDQLYLGERMQRWCGCSISAAYADRAVLMPFFHTAFVNWSLASPAREKYGSRLACRLMAVMAPEIASLPLDSGARPSELAKSGFSSHTRNTLSLGKKVLHRIYRSATGRQRHNIGTKSLTQKLQENGVMSVLDWGALRQSDIFDDAVLDEIEKGQLTLDRASLGFLISVGFTLSCLTESESVFGTGVTGPKDYYDNSRYE
jgi:asparagine synthase (glutamine-hydrolysing)